MVMKYRNHTAVAIIVSFLFTGCAQETEIYTYTETVVDPRAGTASMPDLPKELMQASSRELQWVAPDEWKKDEGHPMRLASFKTANGADVSFIMLPGAAGGLEANIRRWMGQIGLSVPDDVFQHQVNALPLIRTESGWEGRVVNFNEWMASPDLASPSMIAVLLDVDGETGFVKISGTYTALEQERQAFLDFVRSLRK